MLSRIKRYLRERHDDAVARVQRARDLMAQGMSENDAVLSIEEDYRREVRRWPPLEKPELGGRRGRRAKAAADET